MFGLMSPAVISNINDHVCSILLPLHHRLSGAFHTSGVSAAIRWQFTENLLSYSGCSESIRLHSHCPKSLWSMPALGSNSLWSDPASAEKLSRMKNLFLTQEELIWPIYWILFCSSKLLISGIFRSLNVRWKVLFNPIQQIIYIFKNILQNIQ